MGLRKFFTPKWKHKDNFIREKAVRKLKDTERLKMIAQNDSWWKVRKAAYETLGDDQAGKAIEIKNITFQRISKEEVAEKMNAISRAELLLDLAKNADVSTIRLSAVKRIDDDQMLCEIFMNEYDEFVCQAVAKRISDKKMLKKFLDELESWKKRKIIYEQIGEEQKALGEIAKHKKYYGYDGSMEAIKKITDIDVLEDVVKKSKDYQARNDAKKKLSKMDIVAIKQCNDEKKLKEVAQNSNNWKVRKAAFEKLGNEQMALGELAKNEHFFRIEEELKKLTEQSILKDVALNAEDSNARSFAIENISDKKFIFDIAKNDKSQAVRKAAVLELTDAHELLEIAETDEYWKVGSAALKKLKKEHLDFLKAKVGKQEKLEAKFFTLKKAEETAIQKHKEQEAYHDAMDDAYDRMSNWD